MASAPEVVYVEPKGPIPTGPSEPISGRPSRLSTDTGSGEYRPGIRDRVVSGANRLNNMRSAAREADVTLPDWMPKGTGFLKNRTIVLWAWLGSMAVISADEWKTANIFPRPSRLWAATGVFALLAAGSMIDALVPLMNALAIGYFIMLLWEFFGGNQS